MNINEYLQVMVTHKGTLLKELSIRFLIITSVLYFTIIIFNSVIYAQDSIYRKYVLIISSYHQGYKWTDDVNRGINDAFKSMGDVRIYYEYVWAKQVVETEDYYKKLYEIYKLKFVNIKFNVIIISDNDAFNFIKQYRNKLFPDTPIVFCGVNNLEPSELNGYDFFTGVNEKSSFESNIALILKLHPLTKHVVIVTDTTVTGRVIREKMEKVIDRYKELDFTFYQDVKMSDIQKTVNRLQFDSVVLYAVFARDREGYFYEYDDSISLISKASSRPVYGLWDFSLGHGIVGGLLVSAYFQGKTAGEMAIRILDGEDVKKIPIIMDSPNKYMFDFNQMDRFGIKPSDIPNDSIIINLPETLYGKYKSIIWWIIFIILNFMLVVLILTVLIRRRTAQLKLSNARLQKEIEERIKIEEALREAKEVAEKANTMKSDFLASMSHEIRTPLNAILGMASVLSETPLTAEQSQYVHIFSAAGENLLGIINDILDLSKVEAGHLELEVVEFDLREIVEKACEVLSLRAHEKGLELIYNIMPDVPLYLKGDHLRLRQIIFNLIGNAVKFTEKGEIVLHIENAKPEKHIGDLLFSVSDTGIGIPKEKQSAIFESFSQVDSSTTRKYGGTGLGLTISKRLIELTGGKVWVESELGVGSTFYFSVPFEIPKEDKKPQQQVHPINIDGIRALIVDDNDTNRMILKNMLLRWGAVVTEMNDGRNGILELKRAEAAGIPYDLVLLDCRMPEMDGFHVMEKMKIESMEGVTVMMLTSDNRHGDIARAKQLGIDAYLIKPVNPTLLLTTIMKSMGKVKRSQNKDVENVAIIDNIDNKGGQREIKILLVEDYAYNQILIEAYLRETPCHIDIAENGEIAIRKFKTNRYDIVLMDMQMPVVDGYTATKEIRRFEKENGLDTVPIIALTAHALKGDMQKSIDAGCNAYLTKPAKKKELIETIFSFTYSTIQTTENKEGITTLGSNKNNEDRRTVYVDAVFKESIPDFLTDISKDIHDMKDALKNGDYDIIRTLGHRMKGAGGGYGFDLISDIGLALEDASTDKNAQKIDKLLNELSSYLENIEVIYE
ncbi:MAG: response regulator [Candidatus Magnetoovum sp. WYHC-5]|nr:response regulator [Candidatus Magnetoovum sp. WYHC-5]